MIYWNKMSQRWQTGHSVGPSRYPKAGRVNKCESGQRQSPTFIQETRLFPTHFQPQTWELALHRSQERELSTQLLHSQLLVTGWEGGGLQSRPLCACSGKRETSVLVGGSYEKRQETETHALYAPSTDDIKPHLNLLRGVIRSLS